MGQRKTHLPEARILTFRRNDKRKDIFDLEKGKFRMFRYFRFSEPLADYLKKQGAEYVIESWEKGEKILHTGLKYFGRGWYYGNHKKTTNSKRSLLILKFLEKDLIEVHYFNEFDKYRDSLRRSVIDTYLNRKTGIRRDYRNYKPKERGKLK